MDNLTFLEVTYRYE